MVSTLRKKHRRAAFVGAALVGLLTTTGYLAFGRDTPKKPIHPSPNPAAPVVAIEEPATLVPLTLSPPTPAANDVFAKRLMNFSITLDRLRRDAVSPELPRAEAALMRDDVVDALGPKSATALRSLMTVAREASRAPALDQPSVTAIDIATARLDNALLADKLPYFVDTSVMANRKNERIIVFYEFSIIESNLFESGPSRVRSVCHRRTSWEPASTESTEPGSRRKRGQAESSSALIRSRIKRRVSPS